jgi:hypothetical protein
MSFSAMMAVHQEVTERAQKQQGVRQRAKDMGAMLLPEKERSDRSKDAESQPHWNLKTVLHDDSPIE